MIKTVCEKNKCAGCMACQNICPLNAITVVDSIKYYNAIIDESKCIKCKKCTYICQQLSKPILTKPQEWYQGWSKNDTVRSQSSSGGLATEIERRFIENGGVVCSCIFDKGEFIFKIAKSVEEMNDFKGSKYVKSNPSGVYREIKNILKKNTKVLFLGLPCQVAAIKNYINLPNLYTIDIICHGSPSPSVLAAFLKTYKNNIYSLNSISFRSGNHYSVKADNMSFSVPCVMDYYSHSFKSGLILTENCYECNYAQINRVSDLTLGDAWGSELPCDVRKKGVSIALCQTEKGKELLDNNNLEIMPIELEKVISKNTQLSHPIPIPDQREKFLEMIIKGEKYTAIYRKLFPKLYYKNLVKTLLYKVGFHRGYSVE